MNYRHYQQQRKRNMLEVNLFPFLSIFLSVMGVLSFINMLNSTVMPQKIELISLNKTGYKVPYQLFAQEEGIIDVPPIKDLELLKQKFSTDAQHTINEIIQARQSRRASLKTQKRPNPPDNSMVLTLINEINTLNTLATRSGILYEEFLLFGIYPQGGTAYTMFRDIMQTDNASDNISVGLEPLDKNWQFDINKPISVSK